MNIVLLGPQGSGKGTQGKKLAAHLGIPHISTGDLLRDLASQDTDLARKVKGILKRGELVSDELLMQVLKARLERGGAEGGFVLDGTPRNLQQAELLETVADIDLAILIDIPDKESVRRITARWSCPEDKTSYNTITNPPENDLVCDVCGAALTQREDDTPDAVRKRLDIYHERTEPVVDRYRQQEKLAEIDGMQDIPAVWDDVRKAVE